MRRSIILTSFAVCLAVPVSVWANDTVRWAEFAVFSACRFDSGVVGIVEN